MTNLLLVRGRNSTGATSIGVDEESFVTKENGYEQLEQPQIKTVTSSTTTNKSIIGGSGWRYGGGLFGCTVASLAVCTFVYVYGFTTQNILVRYHQSQQVVGITAVDGEVIDEADRGLLPIVVSTSNRPQYTCPPRSGPSQNYDEDDFDEDYLAPAQNISRHLDDFLSSYRVSEYDAWGMSYTNVLEGMRHWKSAHFPTNLQSGETMYESACGIGMNLIMTLEILKEHGIQDITVYGNDYMQDSIDVGQTIVDRLAPTFHGHKGILCQGDSTNLGHIPDESFDLVFTGYLSPLYDPLELNQGWDQDMKRMKQICEQEMDNNDWKSQALSKIATQRQNDWHGKWVYEMIRIAKPGKAVIIEQIRSPMCSKQGNYESHIFGQSKQWWYQAIHDYHWDVDPESLVFEDDIIFRGRYHIFMRKNNNRNTTA